LVIAVDEITRRIVDETIARCDQERREFQLWDHERQRRRAASEPIYETVEPPPAPARQTNTEDGLEALADEAAIALAQLEKKLTKRLERLERLEEVSLLRAENEELRKKAEQLERRVVFVDLSKTHAPVSDDDAVIDFDEARSAVRGRDVA
jgi:hypothetical protein